ncbi:FMN-binding negative transcriptional regulator [Sulfuritalea hydrogenivorans]|uniref:Transcriptional regulator n=1 Tax=Sulfuritalea hydrogenivorans sk43H TaxID=1223802 RepID=W0SN63_9PROT|nr:FMN-binding negative transcriptional regulator [Sulfuritalea hydrogenivorans]BAO31258.1 transcriptional regulator [Sulfuritalea hydrogenivorans sk43H]
MYLPAHFEESRVEVLHALMVEHPFATLLTQGAGGLEANHLPLHLEAEAGPFGVLQGHVARANPLWKQAADSEVLVVFHGPQAYVTPSWYETKREHGKAVPTWNYVVVHAHGRLRAIDDADWLLGNLEALVAHHEAGFAEPWQIGDAPPEYIEKMLAAIVGIEIEITELKGKWKTSQNQPPANRAGVVAGLRELGTDEAAAMAGLVAGTLNP